MMETIKRTYMLMSECGISYNTIKGIFAGDTYSNQLAQYIYDRYKNNWVVYAEQTFLYEEPEAPAIPTDKVTVFKDHLLSIYELSKDRYLKLLALYDAQKNNLLNKLDSVVENKFNDTPLSQGDYSTDSYTSTVSKTTTSTDPTDIMTRLDAIYKSYQDLMKQ